MTKAKDVIELLDEQIAEYRKIETDAITLTDRKQAKIKADVLAEFKELVG